MNVAFCSILQLEKSWDSSYGCYHGAMNRKLSLFSITCLVEGAPKEAENEQNLSNFPFPLLPPHSGLAVFAYRHWKLLAHQIPPWHRQILDWLWK